MKDNECYTELYSPELLSNINVKQGYIQINKVGYKPISYTVMDGLAITEGDIVLGLSEEIEKQTNLFENTSTISNRLEAILIEPILGKSWPKGIIPFNIESDIFNKQRIINAINHWQSNTNIRFIERTNESNYIKFKKSNGCWSYVGMQGGRQYIGLSDNCTEGTVIHEIAHAIGFWHEQSREDRDNWITINWNNIIEDRKHNFDKHVSNGQDIGKYDYGSIMHYHAYAFSINGKPTIAPKVSGVEIGQRKALSMGDIDAVKFIYDYV